MTLRARITKLEKAIESAEQRRGRQRAVEHYTDSELAVICGVDLEIVTDAELSAIAGEEKNDD